MWYYIAMLFVLSVAAILYYKGIIVPDQKILPSSVSSPDDNYTGGLAPLPADLLMHINAALLIIDPESSPMMFAQCAYSAADTWARAQIGNEGGQP